MSVIIEPLETPLSPLLQALRRGKQRTAFALVRLFVLGRIFVRSPKARLSTKTSTINNALFVLSVETRELESEACSTVVMAHAIVVIQSSPFLHITVC